MVAVDRIQGLSGSLAIKTPVRVATTAAISLSGEQTIDGVAVVEGDRVLVKDQASGVDNGIYDTSTGTWARSLDFDGANDVVDGTMVFAREGTLGAALFFRANGTAPVIPGTSSITFTAANPTAIVTSFAATLLSAADAAAARTTLEAPGLEDANTFTATQTLSAGASLGTNGGALLLTPNTGFVQVNANASYAGLLLNAATGSSTLLAAQVNGAEVSRLSSDAGQNFTFGTGSAAAVQAAITHTASANRYLTLTGSNGGNPTIGTSAGSLGISSPISQVTSSGASIVLFQSTAASVENTVHISATQVTSGASLKISNSGNNVQASLRLTGTGHLDISTNQTADAAPTAGNIGFRVVNAVGSRHVTVTPDNTNPTIGVTGGSLAIIPGVICAGAIQSQSGTAVPVGGSGAAFYATTSHIGVYIGSGAPTVSAAKGSLYLRSDGSATNNRMYVNTDGSTTWTAVTTAA